MELTKEGTPLCRAPRLKEFCSQKEGISGSVFAIKGRVNGTGGGDSVEDVAYFGESMSAEMDREASLGPSLIIWGNIIYFTV